MPPSLAFSSSSSSSSAPRAVRPRWKAGVLRPRPPALLALPALGDSSSSSSSCPPQSSSLAHAVAAPEGDDAEYRLITGITRTKENKYKAYIGVQGFCIDTKIMPEISCAKANRVAMERVHHRVCEWLAEDPPEEETITDGEFAAFLRGVLEEVRATAQDVVPWRYHSEIRAPSDRQWHRANTTGSVAEALRSWRQLRQSCGVAGTFNLSEIGEAIKIQRDRAEELAARLLEGLGEGACPSNDEALQVLQGWGFSKNSNRQNVLPEGKDWVASDTLGFVIPQDGSHVPVISKATKGHESVFRLLHRWVQGRLPEFFSDRELPCTSMSLNKGYAAKLHRDGRNAGPSVAVAVGDFTGGRLKYWPSDDGRMDLEVLRTRPNKILDTKNAPVIFDGNLGHEVETFDGERFSVVLFTCPKRDRISESMALEASTKMGVAIPSDEGLSYLRKHLTVPSTQRNINHTTKRRRPVPSRQKGKGTRKTQSRKGVVKVRKQSPVAKDLKRTDKGASKRTPWASALAAATKLFPGEASSHERVKAAKRLYQAQRNKGSSLRAATQAEKARDID